MNIHQNVIVGLLLFSLVAVGFFAIPARDEGFWDAYSYSPTADTTSLSTDVYNNVSGTIDQLNCDIYPQDERCNNKRNIISDLANFGQSLLQGGYGALMTIMNSLGSVRTVFSLVGDVGAGFGIDPAIVMIFVSIIVFLMTYAIIQMIFGGNVQ